MNAILNYPGSKWSMAKEICRIMPQHRSYLEPYFGSGAVLFNKKASAIETVNDADGDITNFFKVVRERGEELARMVAMTPYSRDVFLDAEENLGESDIDRAYKFAIRSRMAHGYKTHQNTGFKIDVYARERSYCVSCWNGMPDIIREAALRLKTVQIENRPAIDIIKKFNHENVLIYADPPYLMSTRRAKLYRHEMSEQDHIDLLEALVKHKAKIIISGYESELYDSYLHGWSKCTKNTYNQNGNPRVEVLWFNFAAGQLELTEE